MNPKNSQYSPEILPQVLDLQQETRFLLAYSGGLDSHVLLHSLAGLRKAYPALEIRVIHINHGLSPKAQEWSRHCCEVCQALGLPFILKTVDIKQYQADCSIEEAARNARYQALAEELQAGECLLVAHNQDDQAETLLLQLLRGAGVKGLAAMPVRKQFAPGKLIRPLLHIPRSALAHYARSQDLIWIEDESNALTSFDRNYLRREVLPQLALHWPGVRKVLTRVTQHCAEASELIDALALQDMASAAGSVAQTLSVAAVADLSPLRQRNVLRFWLRSLQLPVPNASRLLQLQRDFLYSSLDAAPAMVWPGAEVRRFGDDIYAMPPLSPHDATAVLPWDMTQPLLLPHVGLLTATPIQPDAGLAANLQTTVRFRRGGERFQPLGRSGSHPLKKLFQEWKVPPWLRDRVPLIYMGEDLAAIADFAITAKYASVFQIKMF